MITAWVHRFKRWVLAALLAGVVIGTAGCMTSKARYPAGAKPPSRPPLLSPEETKGPPPGPEYTWIKGYWQWDTARRDWVWTRGRWARRPQPNAKWVDGHWRLKDGDVTWVRGHWKVKD